jgi:hypothetical protein
VLGFSETFLSFYHTAPCHTSNDSNASDDPHSNPQSKLPLSVLSIPFASNLDISQSFSPLHNTLRNTINRQVLISVFRISFPFLLRFLDFIFEIQDRIVQRLIERLVNPQKQTKK